MNLNQLMDYIGTHLDLSIMDSAINGVQVANSEASKPLKKLVTAVDCSLATIEKTIDLHGDILLVHHGLYWGKPFPITNRYYKMIKRLIEHDIALIGLHLPLDVDLKWGNNIDLINKLGLRFVKNFGDYKGLKILFKAEEIKSRTFNELVECYKTEFGQPLTVVGDLNSSVDKVGLCSGGGLFGIEDAIKEGCDTFITGDTSHSVYHPVVEVGMNLISGGHYLTETGGVQNLGNAIQQEFGIEHEFVDLPTGL